MKWLYLYAAVLLASCAPIPPRDAHGVPAQWCSGAGNVVAPGWCWPLPYSLGPVSG